jgi:hypothetical protein
MSECEHEWRGVTAALEEHGTDVTYIVEQCTACGRYRINDSPTFVDDV